MISIPLSEIRQKVVDEITPRFNLCIEQTRARWKKDFFVIIQSLPKKKAEVPGVQINIAALEALPTPIFDTDMFFYEYETGELELIWSLPSEQYALNMYQNIEKVHPDDWPLLQHVVNYYDGTLFKMIAEWENRDGTIKREREHASRDLGQSRSTDLILG